MGAKKVAPENSPSSLSKVAQIDSNAQSQAPKSIDARSAVVDHSKSQGTLARDARYGALPTKDQVLQGAGRPNDDPLFGLFKSSSGEGSDLHEFEGSVLHELEDYHGILNGLHGTAPRFQVQDLDEQLHRLDSGVTAYLKQGEGTDGADVVGELQTRIGTERVVLDALLQDVKSGGTFPQHLTFAEVMKLAREGMTLKEMAQAPHQVIKDSITSGRSYRDEYSAQSKALTDLGETPEVARQVLQSGMPLDDVKAFKTAGFDATDAMKLHAEGISPSSAKSMIAAGCTVPVLIAFTKAGFGEEDTLALHAVGIPAATATALRYTGSTVDELVGYRMAGHSADSLLDFTAGGSRTPRRLCWSAPG